MKKLLLHLLIFFSAFAYGQAPNQMNDQGICRNYVGNVLPNKNITVRLSVHDGAAGGPVIYREVRSVTTSNFGMFNIAIGSAGASSVTGTMATINWSTGSKFLQVEIDPAGASDFIDLGAAQLLSVPYALFAGNVANGSPTGAAGGDLSGTYPNPNLAAGAVTTTKLADNAITTVKIADGSVTSAKLAAGVIPSSLPPNGTASGDLSGTYPGPLVSKIQGIGETNSVPANGQVLKFNGTQWAPGTDNGGAPSGPAGGDLSGTYPNPAVTAGAITTLKLADNSITTAKIVDASVTSAKLAAGVIPTSLPPIGVAGGDLTGSYPNPGVTKIQGVTVNTTGATNGQVLKYNGAQWTPGTDNGGVPSGPAGGDLSGTYPNPTVTAGAITTSKLADNSITTIKIADASVTAAKLAAGVIPTSLPPNGSAGGDLLGIYPNPSIDKIKGVSVNGTLPTTGQVLKFNGTQWAPGTDNGGSGSTATGPAGGDLSGNYPDPNIAAGAVTTPKIANGAIVTPKIADDAV